MTIDLTPLVQAVISLAVALITCFLIPAIKAHMSETKFDTMMDVVRGLVYAAEQIYGNGKGAQKLEWVKLRLLARGYDIDTQQVADMIEAAVGEMNFGGISIHADTATTEVSVEAPVEDVATERPTAGRAEGASAAKQDAPETPSAANAVIGGGV